MEVTTANHRDNSFGFVESTVGKAEFKRNAAFSKNSTKEAMFVFEVELKLREIQDNKRKAAHLSRRSSTLKEL